MTTSPVVSVTGELIAELEDELECCGSYNLDADEIAALLAERAELKRDAERYRWLRMADWWDSPVCVIKDPKSQARLGSDCPSRDRLDAAIDAAMQSWPFAPSSYALNSRTKSTGQTTRSATLRASAVTKLNGSIGRFFRVLCGIHE